MASVQHTNPLNTHPQCDSCSFGSKWNARIPVLVHLLLLFIHIPRQRPRHDIVSGPLTLTWLQTDLYVFLSFGCLVLDTGIVNIVVGTLVLATGLLYVIMSFLSHFPLPNPITINWRNWNDFSAEGLDLPHPRNMNNTVVVSARTGPLNRDRPFWFNMKQSEMHERLKSPAPVLSNQHQLPLNEMIHPQQPPKRRH